jgi:hypothetical protein
LELKVQNRWALRVDWRSEIFKYVPNFKIGQSEKIGEDTFAGTRGSEPISESEHLGPANHFVLSF